MTRILPPEKGARAARVTGSSATLALALILAHALVLVLGCGEETTEPLSGDLGRIQGQVVYFDEEAPARVRLERRDTGETTGGWRWTVDLDSEGRFDVSVPAGRYRVQLAPRATDTTLELYLTAAGIQPECIDCEVAVEPAGSSPFLLGNLGRATVEVQVPEGHPDSWTLRLREPNSGLSRSFAASPDSGLIRFEATRLPEFLFEAVLESPYDESIPLRLAHADSLTSGVRPDPQGLVPHRAILPDPTWIAVRTTPPLPAEFVAEVGRPFAVIRGTRTGGLAERMRHDGAGTWITPTLPLFGVTPFRIELFQDWFSAWAGGPTEETATVFAPAPGKIVDVSVEVAGLICAVHAPESRSLQGGRLYLRNAASGFVVAAAGLASTTASTAHFVVGPGPYILEYEPRSRAWSLPSQTLTEPVSVAPGDVHVIEWSLSPGATLHGRLGRRWRKGESFRISMTRADGSYLVDTDLQPDLEPDSLGFRLIALPDGDLLLEHDRADTDVYYPGTTFREVAEWIQIRNGEDIHGVDFLR